MNSQVKILSSALFLLLLCNALWAETIDIPSIDGRVCNQKGEPLQNCLVVVTFIGSHQSVDESGGDVFKLCVTHSMTGPDGEFSLQSEKLVLEDLEGDKAHFIGARVEFNHPSSEPLRLDIANIDDSNSGSVSVFLNGALEHDGGFFGAIAAGWNALKENQFVKQYEEVLSDKVIELKAKDESGNTQRRLRQFHMLYEKNGSKPQVKKSQG